MALVAQIALVADPPSALVSFDEVARVSAALQKQVVRDLEQYWDVRATVDAFARLSDVPAGYWPVIIRDDIERDSAGAHCDPQGQPMALVTAEPAMLWSLTASHEVLEMLVDPYGSRLVAGQSPKEDQGRVEFLVEVCDPVSSRDLAYTVNGIVVSDFYTPHYFDPVASAGVQYSYRGALTEPRQVLRGGYLTWHDPISGEWWQQSWFGKDLNIRKIGQIQPECGLRAAIDRISEKHRAQTQKQPSRRVPKHLTRARAAAEEASRAKAKQWHAHVEKIRAKAERR